MMKRILIPAALIAGLAAAPASAACFADYKAKKNNPLKLHYGVIELSDKACTNRSAASREISERIGKSGWKLLNVMSTFGKDGLSERKNSAGAFYLRY